VDTNDRNFEQGNSKENRQTRVDNRLILEHIIRERDELTPSPEVRAKFVLDLLTAHGPKLTNWDLLCFCTEYLGSQVLIYSWLDEFKIRSLAQIVQEAHYLREEIPETGVI
jgi:hypothetical protein